MSNNHPTVGQLAPATATKDAIHVAIVPVFAGARLKPGGKVIIGDDNLFYPYVTSDHGRVPVGVADPFMGPAIGVGDRFWLFLTPNTVQNLRHEWYHPAFPNTPPPAPEPDVDYDDSCRGC